MESLLLLALFLLLPLIEQLVKFVRRQAGDHDTASAPPKVRRAPPGVALPPPVERVARPQRARPTLRPDQPVPAPPRTAPALPVQATGRRRLGARRALQSRNGLRRAVVLMTILGPCRAVEPETFQQPSR